MIPPSYLFKPIYRRHWEEPDAPAAPARHHDFPGRLHMSLARAAALLRTPGHHARPASAPVTAGC